MFDAIAGLILKQIVAFFNAPLAAIVVCVVELAKLYIPEKLSGKLVPLVAVVLALVVGIFLMKVSVVIALVTGIVSSGAYGVVKNLIQNVGLKTASVSGLPPRTPPTA